MIMLLAHTEVSRSGLEPNLRYVTKEDLDSNDVKEIAEEERVGVNSFDADAEDIRGKVDKICCN